MTPDWALPILIVDDAEIVREALVAVFDDAGYRVQSTSSVLDAMRALAPGPMVVITDWELQAASGLDLCRLIRGVRDGDLVLMFTGRDSAADRRTARTHGVDALISRSVPVTHVLTAVRVGLERLVRQRSAR